MPVGAPALDRRGDAQDSRYLATVRRAMSTPRFRSISTMRSSERTSSGALGVDELLDPVAHRFGRMRLRRPPTPAIAAVKKYFISNMPRGVADRTCSR